MKYLVMECYNSHAVVLDQEGRFLQVANLHYEVGQRVEEVVALEPVQKAAPKSRRIFFTMASLAACLGLVFLGAWSLLRPYGTVRMQINPDVRLTVNRWDYVLEVTPLNHDAKVLTANYSPGVQKVDQVLDDLVGLAAEMGYLAYGGEVNVTVESTHENWKVATEDRILAELTTYTQGNVLVNPQTDPIPPRDWYDSDGDRDDDQDDLERDEDLWEDWEENFHGDPAHEDPDDDDPDEDDRDDDRDEDWDDRDEDDSDDDRDDDEDDDRDDDRDDDDPGDDRDD